MAKELTPWIDYDISTAAEIVEEEKRKAAESDVSFVKFRPGENVFRILPPKAAWLDYYNERGMKPDPFFPYWKHFYERPDEPGTWVSFVCPRRMEGRECPVCKIVAQLRATGDTLDNDTAFQMDAKHRCYVNVIDRDDEAAGPKVMDISYPYSKWTGRSMYEKIRALMVGRAARNIVTPTAKGFDIIITKEGSGRMNTTYTVQADVEPRPLHDDMETMSSWIESQPDLPKLVQPLDIEQLYERIGTSPTPRVRHADRRSLAASTEPEPENVLDTQGFDEDDDIPF